SIAVIVQNTFHVIYNRLDRYIYILKNSKRCLFLYSCSLFPIKMVLIEGKYAHQKSENLDEYFKANGVPYIPRKMMCSTNPTVDISKSGDKWTITTTTMFRTVAYTFKLGEGYEEHMPGTVLKSTTTLEGDKLITVCVAPNGSETVRTYSFSDEGMILTYKHKESQQEAIRHFKRL
ncbi:hypothetical protein D910_09842, partial [Dendroctonus ponderosae]